MIDFGADLCRYTEDYMADLAHTSMGLWNDLEQDAGEDSIRLMSGLLNFGDPNYGAGGPEGTDTLYLISLVETYLPDLLLMLNTDITRIRHFKRPNQKSGASRDAI